MSNLNLTKIYITIFALFLTAASFFGCSDNSNMLGVSGNSSQSQKLDNPPSGVSVVVTRDTMYNTFRIRVTNNMTDTIINDFHVQFKNGITITTNFMCPIGWNVDPNGTDYAQGKVSYKTFGNPVTQGNTVDFYVQLKFKADCTIYYYDWQATRDGIVVKSGTDYNFRNQY